MFETFIESKKGKEDQNDSDKIANILQALSNTISRIISLEFLKSSTLDEIRIIFYAIWNVAFESKNRDLMKEC
jgi:hypothetical protein